MTSVLPGMTVLEAAEPRPPEEPHSSLLPLLVMGAEHTLDTQRDWRFLVPFMQQQNPEVRLSWLTSGSHKDLLSLQADEADIAVCTKAQLCHPNTRNPVAAKIRFI